MAASTRFYKRDHDGKFARVNSLAKKFAAAKAQGVKHTEPQKVAPNKLPKGWHTIKNPAAKPLGKKLWDAKKSGKFKDDHHIFVAAGKAANAYKKQHPTAGQGLSANMVVAAMKQHEYDETGSVVLLGEVHGKLDKSGPRGTPKLTKPKAPSVDTSPSGIAFASNDKFPKPSELKPTGKVLGGVSAAKVYVDDKGQQWVVKSPKPGSNAYGNSAFTVDIEIAASRIQNKAGIKVPAVHKETVDGKVSAVSKMYDTPGSAFGDANGKESVDIDKLSAETLLEVQKQQVLDWLLSNHDSHSGNFLATSDGIVGIDKGQSFKHFGNDKLDWNYTGTSPLHPNVPVYQTLWKQWIGGSDKDINDPKSGDLYATIQRMQNISDDEYKKLLRPYAEKAKSGNVEGFLNDAVARKNNLQKDFDALYARGLKERQKALDTKAEQDAKAAKAKSPNAKTQSKTQSAQENISKFGNTEGYDAKGTPKYTGDLAIGDIIYNYFPPDNATYKVEITAVNKQPGGNEAKGKIVEGLPGAEPIHLQQHSDGTWFDAESFDDASDTFHVGPSTKVSEAKEPAKPKFSGEHKGSWKVGDTVVADTTDSAGFGAEPAVGKIVQVKHATQTSEGKAWIEWDSDKGGDWTEIEQTFGGTWTDNSGDKFGKYEEPKSAVTSKNSGDLAAFDSVEVGDVVVSTFGTNVKVLSKPKNDGYLEGLDMGTGLSYVLYASDFDAGNIKYGDQGAQSSSATKPSKVKIPGEPAKDIDAVAVGDLLDTGEDGVIEVTEIKQHGVTKNTIIKGVLHQQNYADSPYTIYKHDFENGEVFWGAKPSWMGGQKLPPPAPAPNVAPPKVSGNAPATTTTNNYGQKTSLQPTKMAPAGQKSPEPATLDNLSVGDTYHVPNGKEQTITDMIGGPNGQVAVMSVSGNTYTHSNEKFSKFLKDKGVLKGPKPPPTYGNQTPVYPDQVDVGDSFKAPNGAVWKITKVDDGKTVEAEKIYPDTPYGNSPAKISKSWEGGPNDFADSTQGWQFQPPATPWEDYALGNISWEEYQSITGAPDAKKLTKVQGPQPPPGKPKQVAETKAPPSWDKITHPAAKTLGQQIYDRKKAGDFKSDDHMWKEIGKLLNNWKKDNPSNTETISQNMVRNAARRLEFDENGSVVWVESSESLTAKEVEPNIVPLTAYQHVPLIKKPNKGSPNYPASLAPDTSKEAGSFENPHMFSVAESEDWATYGILMTNQNEANWSSKGWSAMKSYTAGGYKAINSYLRSGNTPQYGGSQSSIDKQVEGLDEMFKDRNVVKPLKDWTTFTRATGGGHEAGLGKSEFTFDELKGQIGKTVVNKAFISSSITDIPAWPGGKCRIIYKAPPGYPAMYVDKPPSKKGGWGISSNTGEREAVLPRNTEYKIVSVDKGTNPSYTYDVVVEITGW